MRRLATGTAALIVGLTLAADDPMFSPAFFWMWNAKLEPSVLIAQLEDMHAHGLRNVCVHPFPKAFRPGQFTSEMEPDYLTPGFLDAFAKVAKRAGELGMHCYLYDEGGWPSGGACGKVAASDSEGRFHARRIGYGADGKQPFGVHATPWHRNPDYVSLIEKGATERFLELVHEPTAKAVGDEIGRAVRVAFTDEPAYATGKPGVSLAWTADFAEVFKAKKGYDLVPHVEEMLRRQDDTDDRLARLRIDYHDVLSDLFAERYLAPIQKWCHAHGMLSSGHFGGEDLPENAPRYGFGSLMRNFRKMDAPGVDTIWRQIFPYDVAREMTGRPFPRYASSVMHQQGGKYAMSETFGVYGDSMTPWQMKWIVDYQLARGINTFVFGYLAMSYARQWMLLFEPHNGRVNPSWDMQGQWFRYITRTCEMLSRGRPGAEIAVLYDMRGLWAGGADREAAAWNHYAVAKALDRLNCDYDLVDDDAIAAATVLPGGRLKVGAMEYAALVLPTEKWLLPAARDRLAAFERAGGVVARSGDLARVPRTLRVTGSQPTNMRVLKRIEGRRHAYFVFNEYTWECDATLEFPEGGRIVRYDTDTDLHELVSTNGVVARTFQGGETAIYYAGADLPPADPQTSFGKALKLTDGWTVRRLVSHAAGKTDFEITPCDEPARATGLGDWRRHFGATFSGKALYRVAFDAPRAGRARLDLGNVCWSASIRLNGQEAGARFFGPFVFEVDVRKGRNVLEVTVANLLSNQLGDPTIRQRIAQAYPPCRTYEYKQRNYDGENGQSGLMGPVTVQFAK